MLADSPQNLDFGPDDLSALARMKYVVARAKENNFFWDTPNDVLTKVREELTEVELATSPAHLEEEIGDALFTLACLSYAHGIDAEQALSKAITKLMGRWQALYDMAAQDGKKFKTLSADEIEMYWQRAKKTV